MMMIAGAMPLSLASIRQYEAPLGSSNWMLTKGSPLVCQLEHGIPRFGTAVFISEAGSDSELRMRLEMLRTPRSSGTAKLMAVPPSYRGGEPASLMANVNIYEGFNASLGEKLSWSVLTELEQGYNPTFFYQDGYSRVSDVSVALNSANFKPGMDSFFECVGALLPYGFDDVALTVLNYKKNSDELELESMKRLRKLVDYLKHDSAVIKVEIDAFSDSFGGRWLNSELSKKRAKAVRKFLVDQNVSADKLVSAGYGERRHIASNETEIGRHKNRRVIIRLTRDNSLNPSPMASHALTAKGSAEWQKSENKPSAVAKNNQAAK